MADNVQISQSTALDATTVRTVDVGGVHHSVTIPSNAAGTLDPPITTLSPQSIDTSNSQVISLANASPGSPWVGAWKLTRTAGTIRQLVVLASNVSTGLGGIFTFEYGEDGATATISETRAIDDFVTVRDFDLMNAGAYFRVKFEPDRVMVGGELIFLNTTQRTQFDGAFVRLSNQEIEEQNAAMGQIFAYSKSFNLQGKSSSNRLGGLDPNNSTLTGLGIGGTFTGQYRATDSYESALVFAFSDVALSSVKLQWSPDGVNPRAGAISSTTLTGTLINGFYVYLTVLTTMVDKYVRLEIINGPTATALFEADSWFYAGGFSGSFGGLNATLSPLSTSLLCRSVVAGVDPDDLFENIRTQGRHSLGSSIVPLAADAIFRGKWFPWQESYVKLAVDMIADVPATIHIDFSQEVTPVDGDDSGVTATQEFPYTPAAGTIFRRHVVVQSKWARVRVINGNAAQSVFGLDVSYFVSDPGLGLKDAASEIISSALTGMVDAIDSSEREEVSDEFVHVKTTRNAAGKDGKNVNITQIEDDIRFRPLPTWQVRQFSVAAAAALLDSTKLVGRRSIQVKNHSTTKNCYVGQDATLTQDTGELLPPLSSMAMLLSDAADIYCTTETGGSTSTLDRAGSAGSGTATSPSNALLSNDTRATISANAQTILIDTITPGTSNPLVSVALGIEGRKKSTPASETVAFIDVVTGTAGNLGTVVSASATSNSDHFYLVAVSRRNAAANVTGVTGMGASWEPVTLGEASGFSGEARVSLWKNTTPPTTNGAVTATFSVLATASVIGVYRFSNVNLSAPIQNVEGLVDTALSSAYGDAIVGTALGMAVTFASTSRRTHTAGSSFTEQHETRTGTGVSDAALAGSTLALVATGSQAYSGTLSGTAGWAVIAATLSPRDTTAPIVRLSYKLSAVLGLTTGDITLSSLSDAVQTVDITGDRSWVVGDVANLQLIATGQSIGVAHAEVDQVFLRLVDSTGNVVRVSLKEIA